MIVPFGPWLPDQPRYNNPCITATNVYPIQNGYGPFPDFTTFSDAVPATVKGRISFRQVNGKRETFVGTESKLYRLNGEAWEDVSASAGYENSDFWRFAVYGSRLIATNGVDNPQKFDLGTDAEFSDLTNAPKHKFPLVIRDVLVALDLPESTDDLAFSAVNDSESWTVLSGGGTQAFADGGPVVGGTGGEFGVILQEDAVTRMNFVGGDLRFTFDRIEGGVGCIDPASIVAYKGATFYLGADGFQVFDGAQSRNISAEKVQNTFTANQTPTILEISSAPNLLTGDDANFTSSVGSWSRASFADGTVSHDSANERLKMTNTATTSFPRPCRAVESVAVTAGKTYTITATVGELTAGQTALLYAGESSDGSGQLDSDSRASLGDLQITVTPTGSTLYIFVGNSGTTFTNPSAVVGISSVVVNDTDYEEERTTNDGDFRVARATNVVQGALDPQNSCVVWNYQTSQGSRQLIYNYTLDRWSEADAAIDYLHTSIRSGGPVLAGFNSSRELVLSNGDPRTAVLSTGDLQLMKDRGSMITSVRGLVDAAHDVTVAKKYDLADTESTATASSNSRGKCSLRSGGRYQRIQVSPTATFTEITGAELEVRSGSKV